MREFFVGQQKCFICGTSLQFTSARLSPSVPSLIPDALLSLALANRHLGADRAQPRCHSFVPVAVPTAQPSPMQYLCKLELIHDVFLNHFYSSRTQNSTNTSSANSHQLINIWNRFVIFSYDSKDQLSEWPFVAEIDERFSCVALSGRLPQNCGWSLSKSYL